MLIITLDALKPRMQDILVPFKRVVVYSVMAIIGFVILLILVTSVVEMMSKMFDSDLIILSKQDILQFIGNFLLIVVCIELLDTLLLYAQKHEIHVEIVILVALTAVARELIVIDYENVNNMMLPAVIGIAIAALSTSYFLIRKSHTFSRTDNTLNHIGK